jgi:hypothetical protein
MKSSIAFQAARSACVWVLPPDGARASPRLAYALGRPKSTSDGVWARPTRLSGFILVISPIPRRVMTSVEGLDCNRDWTCSMSGTLRNSSASELVPKGDVPEAVICTWK